MTIQITPRRAGILDQDASGDLGLAYREHFLILCETPEHEWIALATSDVAYGEFTVESLTSGDIPDGPVDLDLSKFPIWIRLDALEPIRGRLA